MVVASHGSIRVKVSVLRSETGGFYITSAETVIVYSPARLYIIGLISI